MDAYTKYGFPARAITATLLTMLALSLTACQTAAPPAAPSTQETPPIEFRPAAVSSRIHFAQGNYPALFAPTSYALWVDESVTELRRTAAEDTGEPVDPAMVVEAERISRDYVIIECHMDSAFADMSIAYDVVGCRGLTLYLSTPDGRKVFPIQTQIDPTLTEEQHQALKLFSRTNLIIFPRRDIWLNQPLVSGKAPSVRLVLEAHNSKFYYEWPGSVPDLPQTGLSMADAKAVMKTKFKDFHARVRRLAHVFD